MKFHPHYKLSALLALVMILLLSGVLNAFAADNAGTRSSMPRAVAAPTLLSPSGAITVDKPSLTWKVVPDAASYLVLLYNGAENLVNEWYGTAALGCNAKVCTLNLTTALPRGEYRWWVKARDGAGTEGPWSSGMIFTQGDESLPGATVLIAPIGEIAVRNPTYQWRQSPYADEYLFLLYDGSDNLENRWLAPDEVTCADGVCSYVSTVNIPAATDMSWWVMGRNERGQGNWSAGAIFKSGALGAVEQLAPTGAIDGIATPTVFSWKDNPLATAYDFYVNAPPDTKKYEKTHTRAEANCDGTKCEVIVNDELADGTSYWWVRAKNQFGESPWSDVSAAFPPEQKHGPWYTGMKFTVGTLPALSALTLDSPTGGAVTDNLTPMLAWTRNAAVAVYQVSIRETAGGTIVFDQWFPAADVCATETACNYTLTTPLTAAAQLTWTARGMTRDGLLPLAADAAFQTP